MQDYLVRIETERQEITRLERRKPGARNCEDGGSRELGYAKNLERIRNSGQRP